MELISNLSLQLIFYKVLYNIELNNITMKPITEKEKLPKFIIVNGVPETKPYNKYLIKPWKKGELVKVAAFEQQVSDSKYDHMFKCVEHENDQKSFRRRYVRVIRKDEKGEWTLNYCAGWENFDLLTSNKKKK